MIGTGKGSGGAGGGGDLPQTTLSRYYSVPQPETNIESGGIGNNEPTIAASVANIQQNGGCKVWDIVFPSGWTGHIDWQLIDSTGVTRTFRYTNPGGAGGRVKGEYVVAHTLAITRTEVGGAATPVLEIQVSRRLPAQHRPLTSISVTDDALNPVSKTSESLAEGWAEIGVIPEGLTYLITGTG